MSTRHLVRSLLQSIVSAHGYTVSGNHLFSRHAMDRINRGQYAASVIELPDAHSPRMVRAARLLSLTY